MRSGQPDRMDQMAGYDAGMITTTFAVQGMTCGHCVAAVTKEVSKITSVTKVDIDLASGSVVVASDAPISAQDFADAVDEAGFEVVS